MNSRGEEETSQLQRTREAEQLREWQEHEDEFLLKQADLRSRIRIQNGRAKTIDLLSKYLRSENDPDAVEMNEPYFYLLGLTLTDLEDLVADIKVIYSFLIIYRVLLPSIPVCLTHG